MRTIMMMFLIFGFCSTSVAGPRAVIVIRTTASVSGDNFDLADIATVTCTDSALRLQLMNTPMGRSPLAGQIRPFTEGNVTLKLRQSGIDPDTLTISGASQLTIVGSVLAQIGSAGQANLPPEPTSAMNAVAGQLKQVLIHPGDKVTLVYDDEGMTISADVTATSAGAAGDTINLRRDGAVRPLSGVVQDAQTVRMVE